MKKLGRRPIVLTILGIWLLLIAVTAPRWLTVFLLGLAALAAATVLAMRRSSRGVRALVPGVAILGLALLAGSWWLGTGPRQPITAVPETGLTTPSPTAAPSTMLSTATPSRPSPTSAIATTPTSTVPATPSLSPTPVLPASTAPTTEITKDVCPNGDWTGDRYDRRCGTSPAPQTQQPVVTTAPPSTTAPTTVATTTTARPPCTDKWCGRSPAPSTSVTCFIPGCIPLSPGPAAPGNSDPDA